MKSQERKGTSYIQ